jgi:hypothetical protein
MQIFISLKKTRIEIKKINQIHNMFDYHFIICGHHITKQNYNTRNTIKNSKHFIIVKCR